ncbi:NAD(P)/FAD-dependent oxidoreductase [Amycolatopsis cihanbeyliensis]|uniref:NADH dehydrogenase FAD-containing subunit n=1 Tax=Amycolatopsis cihanbeyliensis TaxID=1128664 RepID=A0A542DD02_AMYCI|nr:FAD-dependent oxidoreductase [Amycolatopsis cihanbeyliensis]TQJ00942.1 NADH dehydrogenase FAD-containing subunit [Amycolatopsis cihanbeyliensis]
MTPHIVVLGAGYSGLIAAKLAARRTNATVTLVNERDRFVERVRLHQLASGQSLRDLPLADLLGGAGVRTVIGRVTEIDPDDRVVRVAGADPLHYDQLIYALGSRADLESVPGVAEHAYTVAGAEQAQRLRERLEPGSGVVAVAGAWLTGIEAATELAESRPELKVLLLTAGQLGEALSERGRRHLRRVTDRLGIEVRAGARVSEVRPDGLLLDDGSHLAADTVVWTAGFQVPDLAHAAGFAVDEHGRMIVDETLRSVSHPEVYGIGDAAAARMPDGQELRMACATGIPSAPRAVGAVASRLAGKQPRPLRFRYFNQCISLGRRDALIQFVRADDSPVEAVLTGRLAVLYKETIVRGALFVQRHPAMLK